MKQNACYWCRASASNAWNILTELFNNRVTGPRYPSVYYRSLLKLAYRVGGYEEHDRAGFILQGLVRRYVTTRGFINAALELDVEEPIEYPKHILKLCEMIDRHGRRPLTREDFRCYVPYLDEELINELFGEDE